MLREYELEPPSQNALLNPARVPRGLWQCGSQRAGVSYPLISLLNIFEKKVSCCKKCTNVQHQQCGQDIKSEYVFRLVCGVLSVKVCFTYKICVMNCYQDIIPQVSHTLI